MMSLTKAECKSTAQGSVQVPGCPRYPARTICAFLIWCCLCGAEQGLGCIALHFEVLDGLVAWQGKSHASSTPQKAAEIRRAVLQVPRKTGKKKIEEVCLVSFCITWGIPGAWDAALCFFVRVGWPKRTMMYHAGCWCIKQNFEPEVFHISLDDLCMLPSFV